MIVQDPLVRTTKMAAEIITFNTLDQQFFYYKSDNSHLPMFLLHNILAASFLDTSLVLALVHSAHQSPTTLHSSTTHEEDPEVV